MRHDVFRRRDNRPVDPSMAPTIGELISRRLMLKGLAATGVSGLLGCAATVALQASADGSAPFTFTEIGRTKDDKHHVAPGYHVQVFMRQGDPIRDGTPSYRPGAPTAADQALQFGTDNDFIAYMPLPRGSSNGNHGLLGVNHESHRPALCFAGFDPKKPMTREQCEVQMAAQGFTVIEIVKEGNSWRLVGDSRYNRRITANSPMRISGPAAGSARMRTHADPSGTRAFGTFCNCAGGTTPWGTMLSAEENIHYYFSGDATKGPEAAARKRYDIAGKGYYVDWGRYFDRFNMDKEPNEHNRFGWIVEIDPYDPHHTAVKRTALGRFQHECATPAMSHDDRVAFYSGDDGRMEHVYKFVTEGKFDASNPAANRDLLDRGTLYAARFEADGRMRWLPLVLGQGPLTAANGFNDQADVLIEARRAATLLGATPMDRPEDVETHPATGHVYVVLTFNDRRRPDQVNAANPRGPNKFGHIIEIVPPLVGGKPDHGATECEWGFFLMGGDPNVAEHRARYASPVSANGWLAAPDNIAFDPKGRIWIATDGQETWADCNNSLYAAQASGPNRGATRCFFNGPIGCEITGPCFTPDGKTLFLSIQHPGDSQGSTYDKPSTRWPDFRADTPPRSAVVAITASDGGEIGG